MDDFERLLSKYQNKRFLIVDPPGTKGDQLILMGLIKKLNELGISYKILKYTPVNVRFSRFKMLSPFNLHSSAIEKLGHMVFRMFDTLHEKINWMKNESIDIIILRGGGYLNDIWHDYDVLRRIIKNNPNCPIIIAPQSFFFKSTQFSELFENCRQKIHIFCREKYSYELLISMNLPKHIRIYLSHDTALYLSKNDFNLQEKEDSYILIAPRKDRESVVTWKIEKIPRGVKILLGDIVRVPSFDAFVNIIGNASKVYTDRLHNAILSAILGKETYLYPNSYHKNKGVYEFSLCGFPNVKFIDSHKFLGLNF